MSRNEITEAMRKQLLIVKKLTTAAVERKILFVNSKSLRQKFNYVLEKSWYT